MSKKWYEVIKNKGSMPVIKIYGDISPYSNEYSWFHMELTSLLSNNDKVKIRLHCYGGSMFEGLPAYDLMRRNADKIITVADGVVASMGGVLFQGGGVRQMAKHSRLMIHRPSGGRYGQSHELRQYADLLDSLEVDLKRIFIERSGQKEEVVDEWLKPNHDEWLTAEECLAFGLCDEIVEAEMDEIPNDVWDQGKTPEGVFAILNKANSNFPDMKQILLAGIAAKLGADLPVNAQMSDQELADVVVNKLANLQSEVKNYDRKLQEQQAARVEAALAKAKEDGKVNASNEASFKALLIADLDNTEKILASMPKVGSVNNLLQGAKERKESDDSRKSWTYRDFEQKDPAALADMQSNDIDRFKALFKAEYGVEFSINK